MKLWLSTGGMIVAGLLVGRLACGQVSKVSNGVAAEAASSAILRVIDDPATGNRWLLERERPGGPGRLVLASGGNAAKVESRLLSEGDPAPMPVRCSVPVLRAGDAVTLVAHTEAMDAVLEAVALTPAAAGAALRVRLKMGGRIVAAVALAPHRAEWAPASGATQ